MRKPLVLLALTMPIAGFGIGCDSAMLDMSAKPEVTGKGPLEPGGIAPTNPAAPGKLGPAKGEGH